LQYQNPVSYQQQWNLGIERTLSSALTVSVNYVGGHGVDLPIAARRTTCGLAILAQSATPAR